MLQDFTQLQKQAGFNQDLIITILSYDPTAKDKLKRKYLHFVADKEKNDIHFVVNVWESMLASGEFSGVRNLEVWSDGGGKHFKLSSNMYYFSTIKRRYKLKIRYNFYESYHGHNACDAAAAHAKGAIGRYQRDDKIPCWEASNLVTAINSLKHTKAITLESILKERKGEISIETMKGIKSYYLFEFLKQGKVKAYTSSLERTDKKVFLIEGTFIKLAKPASK